MTISFGGMFKQEAEIFKELKGNILAVELLKRKENKKTPKNF